MPRRKQVKNLSDQAVIHINNTVLKNLTQHLNESNCEYCNNYKVEDCLYSLALRNILKDIPVDVAERLHEAAVSVVVCTYSYMREVPYARKLRYLITWIFEFLKFEIRIDFHEDEDYKTIEKFGEHIGSIRFPREFYSERIFFTEGRLLKMLPDITKLVELNLGYFNLTESALESIGNYCARMRIFSGSIDPPNYSFLLLHLLFKDPETQLIKNSCCNTLQCFKNTAFNSSPFDSTPAIWRDEQMKGIRILLKNVPNLIFLNYFEDGLRPVLEVLDQEPGLTIKLRQVDACYPTIEQFEKIERLWPQLRILDYYHHFNPIELLSRLHTLSRITEIRIGYIHFTTELFYKGIFVSKWPSLKKVVLTSVLEIFDVDVVANALENLEYLELSYNQVLWNGESTFKSLITAFIRRYPEIENVDWFQSFSKSIQNITIQNVCNLEIENVLDALVSDPYPNLEVIYIYKLSLFDFELIKAVIDNSPKLQKIGRFDESLKEEVTNCNIYFEENNIDCSLIFLHQRE